MTATGCPLCTGADSDDCSCAEPCGYESCQAIDPGPWDDEPCSHICEDDCCDDEFGYSACTHSHCMNCGGCGCPGYCDDYQTYNLRPAETGGEPQ